MFKTILNIDKKIALSKNNHNKVNIVKLKELKKIAIGFLIDLGKEYMSIKKREKHTKN